MERNLERERLIRTYWERGDTIAKCHQETGIPMSSIGYYYKKFGKRKKAVVSSGSGSVMVNLQSLTLMERLAWAEEKARANARENAETKARDTQKVTRIIINSSYEKWLKKVNELISKGDYRSAKDLCGAIYSIYQVDKIFNNAIKGSDVWSNGLYMTLTEFFDCSRQ